MKRQSVKELKRGMLAVYYLLKAGDKEAKGIGMALLKRMVEVNGEREKIHRRAHTRKQNGKLVQVRAS